MAQHKGNRMDWAMIIAMLVKDLYPVLVDAFKRWLDKLIPKAQAKLESRGAWRGTRKQLLEECLALTPRRQVFHRAMLRSMIEIEGKPTKADKHDLSLLGTCVE